jgi:hypothetical protein
MYPTAQRRRSGLRIHDQLCRASCTRRTAVGIQLDDGCVGEHVGHAEFPFETAARQQCELVGRDVAVTDTRERGGGLTTQPSREAAATR